MSDLTSEHPIERIAAEARRRVESCRDDLRGLLSEAHSRYKETISELELLGALPPDRRSESYCAYVEALTRRKTLQGAAGELDTDILRLRETLARLDEAATQLSGGVGVFGLSRDPSQPTLEAVVIQAQEEERYRLSREIHDGPAQILANVALQLEYISRLATKDPVRARDEMGTMQRDLRLAVGEVRRFMYDLRPPALAQQGVGPAVESHCQRLSERFGLQIEVDWRSNSGWSSSQDTAVFRIVQEALQNVVKHAMATRVQVLAMETGESIEVIVSDNGKGFSPEHMERLDPKHFGLAGMRARAHQIGATLDLDSDTGRGTTVMLRFPLPRAMNGEGYVGDNANPSITVQN